MAVFSMTAPPIPGRTNLLLPNGFWHEHVAFRNDAKVVNWSVLSLSLKPSISTTGRTAGHPCVVFLELACSFYRGVYVLLNLSECSAIIGEVADTDRQRPSCSCPVFCSFAKALV